MNLSRAGGVWVLDGGLATEMERRGFDIKVPPGYFNSTPFFRGPPPGRADLLHNIKFFKIILGNTSIFMLATCACAVKLALQYVTDSLHERPDSKNARRHCLSEEQLTIMAKSSTKVLRQARAMALSMPLMLDYAPVHRVKERGLYYLFSLCCNRLCFEKSLYYVMSGF